MDKFDFLLVAEEAELCRGIEVRQNALRGAVSTSSMPSELNLTGRRPTT